MALLYVTGTGTTGKTSLVSELTGRGFEAHDTDDPGHTGLSGWHLKSNGQRVAGFNELPMTPELCKTHIWGLERGRLEDFALRSAKEKEEIFLCGALQDRQALMSCADAIVLLSTNEETIYRNLQSPRENDWGSEPWQVDRIIAKNQELADEMLPLGAVVVDVTMPRRINDIADEIIEIGLRL